MTLRDAIAVITGGASGIGLGIAKALHRQGAHVILADIEAERAEAAAATLGARAEGAALDVRDAASMQALAERVYQAHGRVDILVNNAGVGAGPASTMDIDEIDFDWLIEVNLKGVWRGIAVFGKRMAAQTTQAVICNVASENSLGFVNQGLGPYAATKHGVLGMSDVLRHEVPPHIAVCVACPGLVRTDIATAGRNGPKGAPPEESLAMARAVMARGMAADEAGEKIAAGIVRRDFIIPTHPHAVKFAETRWQEIADAFAAHEPYTPASENYNVRKIVADMLAAAQKQGKG